MRCSGAGGPWCSRTPEPAVEAVRPAATLAVDHDLAGHQHARGLGRDGDRRIVPVLHLGDRGDSGALLAQGQVELDPGLRPAGQRGDRTAHRRAEPGHVTIASQRVAGPGQAVGGAQPITGCVVHARQGALAARVGDDLPGPQVGDHQEARAGHCAVHQRRRDRDLRGRRDEVHPRLLAGSGAAPSPAGRSPRAGSPPTARRARAGDDPLVPAEVGDALGRQRARRNRLEGRDGQLLPTSCCRHDAHATRGPSPRAARRGPWLGPDHVRRPRRDRAAGRLDRVGGCSPCCAPPAW